MPKEEVTLSQVLEAVHQVHDDVRDLRAFTQDAIQGLATHLDQQIAQVRTDLGREIAEVRSEVATKSTKTDIQRLEERMVTKDYLEGRLAAMAVR